METDLIVKVREELLANAYIKSFVSTHIEVRELPNTRVDKQITLRETEGPSNSIIPVTERTIYVTVWVKQKDNSEPYKTCKQIMGAVKDVLNRRGEDFNKNDLRVNQIVKASAEIYYDAESEYFVGPLVFNCITNEE